MVLGVFLLMRWGLVCFYLNSSLFLLFILFLMQFYLFMIFSGKTVQTIANLAECLAGGDPGPHLFVFLFFSPFSFFPSLFPFPFFLIPLLSFTRIVVPSSTLEHWERELERWCPSLIVLPFYGSQVFFFFFLLLLFS